MRRPVGLTEEQSYDLLLGRLCGLYQCSRLCHIREFLLTRRYLFPYLLEIYNRLDGILPAADRTDILFRWDCDPEEELGHLVVTALTTLSVEASLERLARFDEEYWLDVPPDVASRIIVDIALTEREEATDGD